MVVSLITQTDVILIFLFVVVVFYQFYVPKNEYRSRWYKDLKMKIWGVPRNWMFAIVWIGLFTLMVAAIVLYGRNITTNTQNIYISVFSLLGAQLLLMKAWPWLFFSLKRFWASFAASFLILSTSIAITILFGIENRYIAMGLWIPLPLWLLYSNYLGFAFAWRATYYPPESLKKEWKDMYGRETIYPKIIIKEKEKGEKDMFSKYTGELKNF